jgi:DeoR/GlpR family transcriptional regulator of sugar metabolism
MALKHAMIDGAAQRIVLADASKLDTVAPHAVCALAEIDRASCGRVLTARSQGIEIPG